MVGSLRRRKEGFYCLFFLFCFVAYFFCFVCFVAYFCKLQTFALIKTFSIQVWFQNCRARHKKHASPSHTSSGPLSVLQPARLSPPLADELPLSSYSSVGSPILTALHSYMDGEEAALSFILGVWRHCW